MPQTITYTSHEHAWLASNTTNPKAHALVTKLLYTCIRDCRAPLHKECMKHHGHKGDLEVTLGTCGADGEMAQLILVWALGLPPTHGD